MSAEANKALVRRSIETTEETISRSISPQLAALRAGLDRRYRALRLGIAAARCAVQQQLNGTKGNTADVDAALY